MSSGERVPNHLVKAILVTLFCCLPFGIIGIVHAAGVDGKVASGDLEGAKVASEKANYWSNIGLRLGILFIVLGIVVQVLPFFL